MKRMAEPIICLSMLLAFSIQTNGQTGQHSGQSTTQVKNAKETDKTMPASGTFEVELAPQDDKTGDSTRGRMLIKKKFQGDLEGVSEGQMLSFMA